MDESKHSMVRIIIHQICNMFSPLIENTNTIYIQLTHQWVGLLFFWGTANVVDSSA